MIRIKAPMVWRMWSVAPSGKLLSDLGAYLKSREGIERLAALRSQAEKEAGK